MAYKLKFFALLLLLVHNAKMEPSESYVYSASVVSTTPKPTQEKYVKVLLKELQEMQSIVKVNKYRLEILEMQNVQMKDALEKLQQENLNNTEQILSKIKNTFEDKTNKVKTCENQGQIFKELEKIKSKISQLEGCDNKNQLTELQNKIFEKLDKMNEVLNSHVSSNVQSTQKPDQLPQNCKEVQQRGNKVTGIYTIKPAASPVPFEVKCNMETHGGGWTYLLNRFDGSQDFYLNWTDYKNGFGNLSREFWMGLEHLYEMTGSFSYQLLVELSDWEGKRVYAHFRNFQIANDNENYKLKVLEDYTGDAGNSLTMHVGAEFSTPDRQGKWGHCVKNHKGAWWYTSGCLYSQLTGIYQKQNVTSYATGIHWGNFHGYSYSLKEAAMMIKPSE